MRHTCHAHGCTKAVPASMFACKAHWFSLPARIRAAIWREYEPGQERTKTPSLRYLAVQRFAVAHTAFKPNDEDAARIVAGYLAEATAYAKAAEEAGLGDPLRGLRQTTEEPTR